MSILANDFAARWVAVEASATAAFRRVAASGRYILGPEVERFEAALAARWGLPHAVGCGSGLDALEIALRAAGLPAGEPVLTTPISAFATALGILRAGGVPCFADVDDSGHLDLGALERHLASGEIRWLVPVHLYGHALDLEQLSRLRERFSLHVVEDCAQSIFATSRGRATGTVGETCAVSFYPTKNLGGFGDGGAVLTASAERAALARRLRDYGQAGKNQHSELGLNSRLDELQAALLHDALLPHVDPWIARRCAIAARYRQSLHNSRLTLPPPPEGSEPTWHLFPVLADDAAGFLEHLRARGITALRHYPTLIPDQPALPRPRVLGSLERARRFAAREVSLPIHPFLDDGEVEQVIAACEAWR